MRYHLRHHPRHCYNPTAYTGLTSSPPPSNWSPLFSWDYSTIYPVFPSPQDHQESLPTVLSHPGHITGVTTTCGHPAQPPHEVSSWYIHCGTTFTVTPLHCGTTPLWVHFHCGTTPLWHHSIVAPLLLWLHFYFSLFLSLPGSYTSSLAPEHLPFIVVFIPTHFPSSIIRSSCKVYKQPQLGPISPSLSSSVIHAICWLAALGLVLSSYIFSN